MPRRFGRSYGRFRRSGRRRVNRPAQIVTGKDPTPYPLQLLRKGASYGSVISGVVKQVAGIARMINTEDKYIDTTINLTPDGTSGTVTALNGVAQGTTDITRIGNKIRGKDVYMRFTLQANASSTSTFIRMLLVCDKQYNGADPAITDILQSANTVSPLNRDNTERFAILKDRLISLRLGTEKAAQTHKWYAKIPWHMFYSGTDASDASLQSNALLLVMISNEATNTPSVSGVCRVKFYDN